MNDLMTQEVIPLDEHRSFVKEAEEQLKARDTKIQFLRLEVEALREINLSLQRKAFR